MSSAIVASFIVIALMSCPAARVQSAPADQERTQGGKLSFEVASVKEDKGGRLNSNFPLGAGGGTYSPKGGLFSATNFPVSTYIGFAYSLTPYQAQSLQAQLPKWVNEERFDIQARAVEATTKDEMRLMMQALLADRFKLMAHNVTRQGPVFALVLVKAGKTGPQLHAHSSDADPCGDFTLSASARLANGLPSACEVFMTMLDGRARTVARSVTMAMFAGALPLPGMAALDRPVVNQTGLSGTFDLSLEWVPENTAGQTSESESGPTFLEALKDQLGLKLVPRTVSINTLIVDHIEEPSPN